MMFGAPAGGSPLPVDVGVVQEVHAVDDDALLGRRLPFQHAVAIDHAGVLLDHVVAGTGRDVVAVGPDRRARVIREERPIEGVSVVRSERIGSDADRVAHRVRALRWCAAAGRRPPVDQADRVPRPGPEAEAGFGRRGDSWTRPARPDPRAPVWLGHLAGRRCGRRWASRSATGWPAGRSARRRRRCCAPRTRRRSRRRSCWSSPRRTAPCRWCRTACPFFVKTASREFTVWTMWSGPTARLLSDGLRPGEAPCGPVNPKPRPSKLSSSGTDARVPCDVCSTAAPAAGIVGAGTGGGTGGGGC